MRSTLEGLTVDCQKTKLDDIRNKTLPSSSFDFEFKSTTDYSPDIILDHLQKTTGVRIFESICNFRIYKPEIIETIEIIETFKNLNENWNGYNAKKPDLTSINNSIEIVNQLRTNVTEAKVVHAYPLANGGVQLDVVYLGCEYEIEVFGNDILILEFDSESTFISEKRIPYAFVRNNINSFF